MWPASQPWCWPCRFSAWWGRRWWVRRWSRLWPGPQPRPGDRWGSRLCRAHLSGNNQLEDLRGALADLHQPGIPPVPLHHAVPGVAQPTVDLDGRVGGPGGRLGGEELGHGRLLAEGAPLVLEPGG